MELQIKCQGATTVNIDDLLDLQGNLKELSEDNYHKLRDSMVKYGFRFPVQIWTDSEGHIWTIDSHQRQRVLKKMRLEEGYIIPPLPADIIFADNRIEAKEVLLLKEGQYGHITQEGFDEYIQDIPMEDISDLLAIDGVMYETSEGIANEPEPEKPQKQVTCPNCNHTFTPSP